MNPHIFVYGSLLSGAGHEMGAALSRRATLVGEGTINARLYVLSWYPGIVEDAKARVWGEVYKLHDAGKSLPWLDDYEASSPASDETPEYARVERSVRMGDGRDLIAWVYLYQNSVDGLRDVPSGRWLDYLAK